MSKFIFRRILQVLGFLVAVWTGFPATVLAQTAPVDLTDMSLSELLSVKVARHTPDSGYTLVKEHGRWHFRYQYVRKEFEGYRDGTRRVSNEAVLWRPGEVRTNKNFPVIPTKIIQEAHVAEITFDASDRISLSLMIPYLRQSTDHISIVPGYDKFAITSSGIGDMSLSASYTLWQAEHHSFRFGGGLSFPSGSVHERGDTPRASGDQRLPYTMQLGSGTYDIIGHMTYVGESSQLRHLTWLRALTWGGQIWGKVRTGKNDRNYRLGDRLILKTWLRAQPFNWLAPSVKLTLQFWDHIHGADADLTVPGPFPFPAPVTNPNFFGGTKVNLSGGFRLTWPDGFLAGTVGDILAKQSIIFEIGLPIYQSLKGPQPEEDWELGLSWYWRF